MSAVLPPALAYPAILVLFYPARRKGLEVAVSYIAFVQSLELGDPRAKWPTCSSISKRVREIHARASEPGWYIGLILVRDPEGYQISWIDHMVLGWSHFLASRSSTTGSNRHPPRHPPPLKTSLRLDADMLRLDTDILQYITQVMVFFAFPSCL